MMKRSGRRGRVARHLATALLAALLAGACAADEPAAPTSPTNAAGEVPEASGPVEIGIVPKGPEWGYLGMAGKLGLYDKHGVTVEFVQLQSASQIFPALFSGEVDAVYQSPGGVFVAAKRGDVNAKVIASAMEGLPYAIYGKPDVAGLEDLEGKTMAISSPTGLPALVAKEMLRAAGVDPDDVEYVNGGGNPDRYRAVVSGQADAASSPADFIPQTEADGVKVLGRSWEVIPDYPRLEVIARTETLRDNPGGIVRYLAALIEGLRYAAEHPDETRALAVAESGRPADDPVIDFTLDLIAERDMISTDAEFSTAKLEFLMEVLVRHGLLDEPMDVAEFIDDSYRQQALELLGGG